MKSVVRWVEVHGLAVAGGEAGIARDVGGRVGGVWLARSQFADAARLAGLTLTLGEDAHAFYQLGWARDSTGDRTAALAAYDQALRLHRAAVDHGNEAASGNPRLLDWLDKIVADPTLDVDDLLAAIENEAERFRESIFARKLLDAQPAGLRTMLAKVNVVELPVPAATVYAIHDHPEAASHLRRAVQLGLLEEGTDPETSEPRYFVSNVLRPLIRPLITDDEYREACAAAARSLYPIWVTQEPAADAD